MKIGKLPEPVLQRSVLKQLHKRRDDILLGAAVGEDCAAVTLDEDEVFVLSTDPITAAASQIGELAVQITVNDLASAGATPVGLMLTVLLPPRVREIALRRVMEQIDAACDSVGIEVMGGHTEVTPVVNQILVTVCGVGKVKRNQLVTTGGAKPGMDIVVTKWIGIEGTMILAEEKEKDLLTHFSLDFIEEAKSFRKYLSVLPEAAGAVKSGVSAMHDVTEGGIFGAFWEMAQASGVGLEIDLKKIPIRQETVEICEFFGLNPYQLISSGSMLMATEDGNRLVHDLAQAGIHAVVVGKATDGNDRVIVNDGERRFLEPPKTDEIYLVLG